MLAAALCALLALSAFGQKDGSGTGALMIAIAIGLVWYAYSRPDVLVLRTASGDQNALSSTDKDLMHKVKDAIEIAVMKRG